MDVVYHGSKEQGLTRLEPRESTHGKYLYATPDFVLALHFSGRCGDDLTYDIGRFNQDNSGPWEIVENIPRAFEKMYSNSSSIYTLPSDTFEDINTGFCEVVSTTPVDVLSEQQCSSVYDALQEAEKQGLVKLYRYPNKPQNMKQDGSNILDKWRRYRKMGKEFDKNAFDRLAYLHPELLDNINELSQEFGYDYQYRPEDLVGLFRSRSERQIKAPEQEQFVDSSYISICSTYPDLKPQIDPIYESYNNSIGSKTDISQIHNY